MRLTPLDIKKQDFGRVLRGFDPEEVQAFLSMVADEWEDIRAEHRRMESKVRELEAKLDHYEKVEEALQEALQTARERSESKLEQAERHAALTVQEAKAQAREIVQEAEQRRQQLQSDIERLAERRGEVVARLRAFLNSELEVLSRFGGAHPLEPSGGAAGDSSKETPVESEDDVLNSPPFSEDPSDASSDARSPQAEASNAPPSDMVHSEPIQHRDTSADADEASYAAPDEAPNASTKPRPESPLEEGEAEGDVAMDDALFDFFDLDQEGEAIQEGARGDEDARAAETEGAPFRAEEAPDEGAEPDGNDEIERIRRMLDELE